MVFKTGFEVSRGVFRTSSRFCVVSCGRAHTLKQ